MTEGREGTDESIVRSSFVRSLKKAGGPGLLRGLLTEGAVPGLRPNRCLSPGRSALLHSLAVHGQVEAFALDLRIDTQADDDVDHLEDDQADDGVVDEDDHDALHLVEQLTG